MKIRLKNPKPNFFEITQHNIYLGLKTQKHFILLFFSLSFLSPMVLLSFHSNNQPFSCKLAPPLHLPTPTISLDNDLTDDDLQQCGQLWPAWFNFALALARNPPPPPSSNTATINLHASFSPLLPRQSTSLSFFLPCRSKRPPLPSMISSLFHGKLGFKLRPSKTSHANWLSLISPIIIFVFNHGQPSFVWDIVFP